MDTPNTYSAGFEAGIRYALLNLEEFWPEVCNTDLWAEMATPAMKAEVEA